MVYISLNEKLIYFLENKDINYDKMNFFSTEKIRVGCLLMQKAGLS